MNNVSISFTNLIAATTLTFIALLLIQALHHKVSDFQRFTGFVADYRLLPQALTRPAAILLAALEATALALLIYPTSPPASQTAGATLAALLFGLYGLAIGINLLRHHTRIQCGCGGPPQWLSWRLSLRNALLTALALFAAIHHGPLSSPAEAALTVLAGLTLWVLYNGIDQLTANSAQLHQPNANTLFHLVDKENAR